MFFFRVFVILFLTVGISYAKFSGSFEKISVPQDSLALFTADSIVIEVGDAFDDSRAYSYLDSTLFHILNVIHIETRKSVVQKLLLFEKGDTLSLYNLIESERLLRDQRYLSDATITKETADGKNIVKAKTSDNWTLSVPLSLEHPGDEWYYGIGIQENNFLGFGQTVGAYYSHDEFRDMYSFLYENTHFLLHYNHLRATYSYNTDGYAAYVQMNMPYLSRSKNQFAYTVEGFLSQGDKTFYSSGRLPYGAVKIPEVSADTLQEYNGEDALHLLKAKKFEEDSVSFRLGRSFGSSVFKLYMTGSYDFYEYGKEYDKIYRYLFGYEDNAYALSEEALKDWIKPYRDSRFGFSLEISKIRYDRFKNFRNVKWVEDVDRGYSLKAKISKNSRTLGATSSDWRLDYRLFLGLGNKLHHLSLVASSFFYFDADSRHDIYEKLVLEYIFKPSLRHATVLSGQMDTYKRSPYGKQLTFGGAEGLNGLPTSIFAGQARFYAHLEERYFPNIEIGTVVPVFAAFVTAGETARSFEEFEPKDLQYLAGFGVRFAMTKSIMRSVSHIDISWPLHGPIKKDIVPKISIIGKFSL